MKLWLDLVALARKRVSGTEKGEKCLEDQRRGVKEVAEAMMAVRQSSSCRFLDVAV